MMSTKIRSHNNCRKNFERQLYLLSSQITVMHYNINPTLRPEWAFCMHPFWNFRDYLSCYVIIFSNQYLLLLKKYDSGLSSLMNKKSLPLDCCFSFTTNALCSIPILLWLPLRCTKGIFLILNEAWFLLSSAFSIGQLLRYLCLLTKCLYSTGM